MNYGRFAMRHFERVSMGRLRVQVRRLDVLSLAMASMNLRLRFDFSFPPHPVSAMPAAMAVPHRVVAITAPMMAVAAVTTIMPLAIAGTRESPLFPGPARISLIAAGVVIL